MPHDDTMPPRTLAIDGLLCLSDGNGIDGVDVLWALDNHSLGGSRTPAGAMTFAAKHYGDRPGDAAVAATRRKRSVGGIGRRLPRLGSTAIHS